ncbi:MAG: hypothetical protein WC758_00785 [Candidatus Woesearchaeota archaeon]|jgi:hypothetical protein
MNSNEQNTQISNIKKYNWKKDLAEKAIIFTLFANFIYAGASYDGRSKGMSEYDIRSKSCMTYYDKDTNKQTPIKEPFYWMTMPGRELGLFLYDKYHK